MAYVPGQLKEDDEQIGAPGAPTVSGPSVGSTPSVGGTVAGSSALAQPQGAAGTGFTNIDRVLAANRGAGQQVAQRAGEATKADASAFDTKLGTAQQQMAAQPGLADPTKLVSDVLGQTTPGSDFGNSSAPKGQTVPRGTSQDLQNQAITAAQNALNAQYTAPLEVGHDVGNTTDAKRAKALGDAKTAGTQIAEDTGTLGQYRGTGLDAIDRAIYGSAQENPALAQAAAATDAQIKKQGEQSTTFAGQSKAAADALERNKGEIRTAFGAAADKIKADAKTQADAALAEQSRAKKDIIPTAADRVTWDPGSGDPTAENFLDAGGLNAIGKVLGDQSLMDAKAGPAYVAGKNVYNNDAPQSFDGDTAAPPADSSIIAPKTYTTQQVANATRGLTPEQLATYQQIRKADPSVSPADAAARARGETDTRSGGATDVKLPPGETTGGKYTGPLTGGVGGMEGGTTSGDAIVGARTPDNEKANAGRTTSDVAMNRRGMSYEEQVEYERIMASDPNISAADAAAQAKRPGQEALTGIQGSIVQMLAMLGGA